MKPDLVATKCDDEGSLCSVILDAQILSATAIQDWHATKIAKYASHLDLRNLIRARHHSTNVQTVAVTLSRKGVWLPESVDILTALGLSRGFLNELNPRDLRGSLLGWYSFNCGTCVYGRAGVGQRLTLDAPSESLSACLSPYHCS